MAGLNLPGKIVLVCGLLLLAAALIERVSGAHAVAHEHFVEGMLMVLAAHTRGLGRA